jgi:hypothetical protein
MVMVWTVIFIGGLFILYFFFLILLPILVEGVRICLYLNVGMFITFGIIFFTLYAGYQAGILT